MRPGAVLLVTQDDELREQVCALAAAVGVRPAVSTGDGLERTTWLHADLVLVDADSTTRLAEHPRRSEVILIARDDQGGVRERARAVGAGLVAMLPQSEGWLSGRFAQIGQESVRLAPVLAVAGGRGGAGASVTAAALALTAADRGMSVLLLDTDETGSGLDLVLGMEDVPGVRWPGLAGLSEPVPAVDLLPELPTTGGLKVVSVDRDQVQIRPEAVAAVISTARPAVDLVVVDVARGVTPPATAACSWAAHGLVVVPAEARAAVSAAAVGQALGSVIRDLRLLVRGPAPGGLDAATVAEATGLPLAGSVRAEPGLDLALEHGDRPRPRGPLRRFCGDYLDLVGQAA